jgi:hypothetical protein
MTATILANTAIESAYHVSQWPLNLGKDHRTINRLRRLQRI